jgi:hypothetical protein
VDFIHTLRSLFFFFFAVLGFELRTLCFQAGATHSLCFALVIFQIGSPIFAQGWLWTLVLLLIPPR